MLALAVSLLFALAAFSALAVLAASIVSGTRRVRTILAELAEIERQACVIRARSVNSPVRLQPRPMFQPMLAAA